MSKPAGPTRAVLDLLEVQTALDVSAQVGKPITPAEAAKLAAKIEAARNLLQRTILEAARILEDGA